MGDVLTFRELEAFASLWTTRFLTLNGTRVASHETMFAEQSLVFGVNSDESASDTETKSFGLAFVAATVESDNDVVFFGYVEGCEGLLNDILQNRGREVYVEGAVIDGDCTVTFFEDYASHSGFTATYGVDCFHTFD